MLGVMNPHLPSGPGVLGSLSRFSFLPNDGWQPTQAGDLLGGNSLLGTPSPTQLVPPPQLLQAQQQQRSLVALQEGTLRLNGGEQPHPGAGQHWQGEVAAIASGGGERMGATAVMAEASGGELSNAWLLDLLSKQDGAGGSPADPQHAYGAAFVASAGLGNVPGSGTAVQQDQTTPFAAAPLQPRVPPSAAQQPPFGSITPYLQQSLHRERQQQAQHLAQQQQQHLYSHLPQARLSPPQQQRQQGGNQRGEAAGNGELPGGSARPGGAVEPSQKQQQEMWRRGLFSEVFDGGQRAESPFHIPDLGDIEAPDMDDLLMGGLGLDEPFQPLGLPASTPPKPASLAPPGRGAFPASPGQAQQPAPQRPGSSPGLQALQSRRGGALESEAAAGMLGTLRQQGPAASPFMSAQPSPLAELAGRQPAQQEQGELAADRAAAGAPAKPAQGRGPSKKAVAAKKAAASKRQKAASAAAAKAATAAAKRARVRLEQESAAATTTTLVEWCTEEEPAADDEMKELPAWPAKDAALLPLSPAAALVAAGACAGTFAGGKEPRRPAATVHNVGHDHQDVDTCRVATPAVAAAGKASCVAPQEDAGPDGLRVLGWLFGAQLPKRWSLSP